MMSTVVYESVLHRPPEDGFGALVDESIAAEQSLLLRYHLVLSQLHPDIAVSKEDLTASSIREGARIFRLTQYRGVDILVCDESSLMATGTYKDLDACLMAAIANRTGLNAIVLSSGGNLGYAMARYARQAGLRVYLFHPKSTLYKLDAANFGWEGVKVIPVDRPEPEVKALARDFADAYGITHVPHLDWRFAASTVRAMHIAEKLLLPGKQVDWVAQAICAGFGPVGVYDCWAWLIREGLLRPAAVPRFLGVQQAANAPIVRAWEAGAREITEEYADNRAKDRYIEPGLYNTNPNVNYSNLRSLMDQFGGVFLEVQGEEYQASEETVLRWFHDAGLEFTRIPQTAAILERAGILTGVGILKAIEQGAVKPGARVLYLLTGGFRRLSSFEQLQPELEVDGKRPIADWVRDLGAAFGLGKRVR
jgi:threonine synthase